MGDLTAPLNSSPALNPVPTRATPFREDCWSEEATATLVDAWGSRYLELNRGNLRQKDWQEVADAVNSRHGRTKKQMRTDIQCKNRIDTIKKKYKAEKARVSESGGAFVSSWRFFEQLDVLIGPKKGEAFTRRTPPGGSGFNGFRRAEAFPRGTRTGMGGGIGTGTPPMAIVLHREANQLPEAVAVTPLKRSSAVVDDSYFRRNYSAMAAAAAKDEADDEEEYSEEEETEVSGEERGGKRVAMDVEERGGKRVALDVEERGGKRVAMDVEERGGKRVEMDGEERGGKQVEMDGTKMLALAIDRFGETYQKVEMEKLRQFMEIEQKRIDVGRDVELQRTQLLMDTKIQLEKLNRKHAKKKSSGLDDICSS